LTLRIGQAEIGHIYRHARESYPHECAGAIVGTDTGDAKTVADVWAAENTHEGERERRFLIDPLAYKKFEERAEDRGMDVLGFYHSHPDEAARPSEYDREHALPNCSYVITSVTGQGIEDTRCWLLRDDRSGYDEETLVE